MGVGTTETTMVNAPYTPIISERVFLIEQVIALLRLQARNYESYSFTVEANTHDFRSGWAWISLPNCPALIERNIDSPESERSAESGPRIGYPCHASAGV